MLAMALFRRILVLMLFPLEETVSQMNLLLSIMTKKILFLTIRIKSQRQILKTGYRREVYILRKTLTSGIERLSPCMIRPKVYIKALYWSLLMVKASLFILPYLFLDNYRLEFPELIDYL